MPRPHKSKKLAAIITDFAIIKTLILKRIPNENRL